MNRIARDEQSPWWRRFSSHWLLGRQLSQLDEWPLTDNEVMEGTPLSRLNYAIRWHTLAHLQAKRWYTALKVLEIAAAAAIPVLAATDGEAFATKGWIAGLGALVVILEGI